MNKLRVILAMSVIVLSTLDSAAQSPDEDPYLWLEEVNGARALEWVRAQNAATAAVLEGHREFWSINKRLLDILNSKARIASPSIVGDHIYNFWQDETHPRGIWRRVPRDGYFADDPPWEIVLDLDALSAKDGEKWAYKGADFLHPDYDRCLLFLSRGGSDAVEVREFDLRTKSFVEDGFFLPEAKVSTSWIDRNTIYVGSSAWEGMATSSGYPRTARLWKRGTPLEDAPVIFEGKTTDVSAVVYTIETPERQYTFAHRGTTFFTSEICMLEGEQFVRLEIPEDAQFHGFFKNQMLVELKSEWTVGGRSYPQGALIGIDYDRYREGARDFAVLYAPDERSSIAAVDMTENQVLISRLRNVKSELMKGRFEAGQWYFENVPMPENVTISLGSTDRFSDRYFYYVENFLQPRTLYFVAGRDAAPVEAKRLPRFFSSEGLEIAQHEAVSADGERIPYFMVSRKGIPLDGSNPTLIEAYGGFEVSQQPYYDATTGATWLEYGGVYVLANIRGGGEFGPRWHRAALKEKRQTAFDDLYAVSEDLIRRRVTSPRRLGIAGGSNGGLLVGAAFTQRPELYTAVACGVPLLDMRRYSHLLAGASWMAEYGDPDVLEEWDYIKKYSPYHNLAAGKKYPKVLFTTTTHDDRVHPAHARKMAAKMQDLGHECLYFENTEGGHGAGVTNEQRAYQLSIEATYLHMMLR